MSFLKKKRNIAVLELSIFLLIWGIVFISPIIIRNTNEAYSWQKVIHNWNRLIPFLVLSLINHFFLVPFIFFKKGKLVYLLTTVLLIAAFSFALFVIQKPGRHNLSDTATHVERPPHKMNAPPQRPPPRLKPGNRPAQIPPPGQTPLGLPPYLNTALIALLILGFDTGLRTVFKWTASEQEKEVLENENVKNELAFLRNQISPHFFMNTLNNIHALIDIDQEEAKESVIKLSKLMRHLLYDSDLERISISKELEFIKSYIELMRLRFNEKVNIEVDIADAIPDKQIPPLLFTSFLENAFKHGVSYNSNSFINLKIHFSDTELIFEIGNSIPTSKSELESTGIGLENIRKRLDLIYGKQYSLFISNNSTRFDVSLTIPL